MPSYFCIVRFDERAKRTLVVKSSSIRSYDPQHPDDFERGKTYDVSWQEGEGSFDGFYPAFILHQSASLEELKKKASAAGMKRMPSNFNTLLSCEENQLQANDSDTSVPSKKRVSKPPNKFTVSGLGKQSEQARKNLKRMPEKTDAQSARKRCMLETLQQINQQAPNNDNISNSQKMEGNEAAEIPDVEQPKPTLEKKDELKMSENFPEKKASLTVASKFSPPTKPEDMEGCSVENFSVRNALKKIAQSDSLDINENYSDQGTVNGKSQESKDGDSEVEDCFDTSSGSSSTEASVSKLLSTISELEEQLKEKKKEFKAVTAAHLLEVQEMKSQHEKEMRCLRHACRMSEDKRFELIDELKAKTTEIKKCDLLQKENNRLKRLIATAQELLFTGVSQLACSSIEPSTPVKLCHSTPKKGNSIVKPCHSTPKKGNSVSLSSQGMDKSLSLDASWSSEFKMSSVTPPLISSSPQKQKITTASKTPSLLKEESPRPSSSRSSNASKRSKPKGLSKEEIADIAERVKKDLMGEEPLATDNSGKITIGGGVKISQKSWNEGIRNQSTSSRFCKKLAQAVYGHEGLRKRTVGSAKDKDTTKQIATPSKIDAIEGCYRGRLLSENPNRKDAVEMSARARYFVGQKMQDEARPRNKEPKPTPTSCKPKKEVDDKES